MGSMSGCHETPKSILKSQTVSFPSDHRVGKEQIKTEEELFRKDVHCWELGGVRARHHTAISCCAPPACACALGPAWCGLATTITPWWARTSAARRSNLSL